MPPNIERALTCQPARNDPWQQQNLPHENAEVQTISTQRAGVRWYLGAILFALICIVFLSSAWALHGVAAKWREEYALIARYPRYPWMGEYQSDDFGIECSAVVVGLIGSAAGTGAIGCVRKVLAGRDCH